MGSITSYPRFHTDEGVDLRQVIQLHQETHQRYESALCKALQAWLDYIQASEAREHKRARKLKRVALAETDRVLR